MNIASFLLPKAEVAYLRDDMTLRQGLEKLRRSGFTAIPVIDKEDRYVGVVSVADFLWNILAYNQNLEDITLKSLEHLTVRDFLQNGKVKAACIDTAMENLLEQAKSQNFVPVIDDRSVFIGIVTRSDIIKYFVDGRKNY
ncbi:CBS domain-containing protein [bacterium D16-50]|nr:CBS domain-containing protein [Lachnospiraceae bacterium]RKJ19078.1 CBS domain-containing protein [bacterium D16-50]